MAIAFNDLSPIFGAHELKPGPWEYQRQPNSLFGVAGQTVVAGQRVTREIVVESWLFDDNAPFAAAQDVQNYCDDIEDRAGTVDTLTESGDISRTFSNCEFQRLEWVRGPMPPGGNIQGWWGQVRLFFIQLKP